MPATKSGRKIPVLLRPEHHVPVVWHHAVAANPHPSGPERLGHGFDEALVVGGAWEDRSPPHGPVEDVKRQAAGGDAVWARHGRMYTFCRSGVKLPRFGGWHLFSGGEILRNLLTRHLEVVYTCSYGHSCRNRICRCRTLACRETGADALSSLATSGRGGAAARAAHLHV